MGVGPRLLVFTRPGKRWNVAIQHTLKHNFFLPLRRRGWSRTVSVLTTFAVRWVRIYYLLLIVVVDFMP